MNNIENNSKEKQSMNPVVKYLIIALTTIGVAGAGIFAVYKSNEVKQAAQQQEVVTNNATDPSLLNDKSGQETIDAEALAEKYYNENKEAIKTDTTLTSWKEVFLEYWDSTQHDEQATLNSCLAYFAPDTILPGDVEDPESMEVKIDEEDAALVALEMTGEPDDATENEDAGEAASTETTEVQQEENLSENTETPITTETAKNYEVDYYDESKTMYAIRNVNIRKGPDAKDFDKVGSLKINEAIKVTGVVEEYNDEDTFWLAVEYKGQEYFISGAYLSDTKVATQTNTGSNSTSNSGQQSQPSQNNSSSNSGQQSSGNSSAWDILNGNVNHDYSTSGEATGENGHGDSGINWN